MLIERAPAKINLSLHVVGRRPDGFHDLESLVAFSAAGDLMTYEPGRDWSLVVDGPTAAAAGPVEENLALKAARAFDAAGLGADRGRLRLTKRLPAAAGVGGGSSDAAAALRLLARHHRIDVHDPRLREIARAIGSDVPVCVEPRARMMSGVGDRLGPPIRLPPLFAVLVNPGAPLETRAVFARMGLRPGEAHGFGRHPVIADGMTFDAAISALRKGRNDMEDAASVILPAITHVLAVIGAARGCRLARMSGSGATCFGLFETCRAASRAAKVIRRDHPEWWAKATILR